MRVAIYARVSTDAQEARGTIGSQLTLLRERVTKEAHELVPGRAQVGSGALSPHPGRGSHRLTHKPPKKLDQGLRPWTP